MGVAIIAIGAVVVFFLLRQPPAEAPKQFDPLKDILGEIPAAIDAVGGAVKTGAVAVKNFFTTGKPIGPGKIITSSTLGTSPTATPTSTTVGSSPSASAVRPAPIAHQEQSLAAKAANRGR